jgi:FHA domain
MGTRTTSASLKFSALQGPHCGSSFAFTISFSIDAITFIGKCEEVLVLGRSPVTALSGGSARGISLCLPLDKEASATHAQIEFDGILDNEASHEPRLIGVTARLVDLASTNGTRVNSLSAPVVPGSRKGLPAVTVPSDNLNYCPVTVGDVIRIGSSFFVAG